MLKFLVRQSPGDVNAASFGKLARGDVSQAAPADLAHAILALVAENVGLVCAGLAAATQTQHIVFGGTTLRNNASLIEILRGVILASGREAYFLPDGEFTGALGALELSVATRESAG